ncbi:MAG: P13 family porin [Treponema sp.]|nr:P13 family porin [Treponema sp.]
MKKILVVLLVCLTGFGAFAQDIALDEAIQTTALEMGQRLPHGGKVAVLSFSSESDRLSGYVIDELNNVIVNEGSLTVVDRQQLDLIMQEMQFQESGLVSDDSAQEIGRMLGAQYIVSGSIELIAGSYRLRIRALTVENATIVYSGSWNVANGDRIIASFTGGGAGGTAGGSGGGTSGGSREASTGNFTTAEVNRARWLNILFGIGSFSQQDILGGAITAGLEAGGVILVCVGIAVAVDNNYERWDSGGYSYSEDSSGYVLAALGGALYIGGAIYGYLRPSSFARRSASVARGPLDNLNIALVSDQRGDPGLRLSYKLSF